VSVPTPTGAWMQTVDGRAVQLDAPPAPGCITQRSIESGTLHCVRFAGQCSGRQIPVMQHEVWGCDAILAETSDVVSAAYFLIHDAHEGLIGDLTTPVVAALAARAGTIHPVAGLAIQSAVKRMKQDLDAEIHALYGLPYPVPEPYAARVKAMDLRMLETERRLHLEAGLDPSTLPAWTHDAKPPLQAMLLLAPQSRTGLFALYRSRIADLIPRARALLGLDRPQPPPAPLPGDDAERFLRLVRSH
jgi:uncharacterized protein